MVNLNQAFETRKHTANALLPVQLITVL